MFTRSFFFEPSFHRPKDCANVSKDGKSPTGAVRDPYCFMFVEGNSIISSLLVVGVGGLKYRLAVPKAVPPSGMFPRVSPPASSL